MHIARLAELAVDDEALPAVALELSKILEFVAQLDQVPAGSPRPFLAGPDLAPLRADEVKPIPLGLPPGAIAPEFRDGFFLVPRLAVHADPAADDGEAEE
jgi:aspartyl-tRNA(Asn)/glutamyl-tRNA(Gln) amidotransferase subunit C